MKKKESVFDQYVTDQPFVDKYLVTKKQAVDVIIPIAHTNELWEKNLLSFYREIPIKNLIISNGGCVDDSIEIVKRFPRVKILDHSKFVSLGYCISKLISEVTTEWFVYLHSDVYLPACWYEKMVKNQKKYDWYECRQHMTVLIDYPLDYHVIDRPLSGSQMGKKAAFEKVLPEIEDDYLYRNEDIILANLIQKNGFKYGRVDEAFHYHQLMNKRSRWKRQIKNLSFQIEKGKEEKDREFLMQIKGIVKYLQPDDVLIKEVKHSIAAMDNLNKNEWAELREWIKQTNLCWLPFIKRKPFYKIWASLFFQKIARTVTRFIS